MSSLPPPAAETTDIPAAGARLTGLHEVPSGSTGLQDRDAVRRSAWPRLRNRLQTAPRKGDDALDGAVAPDRQGDLRLTTTPPLARASMCPTPWNNNPLRRLWRWMQARMFGRVHMQARSGVSATAPGRPDAAWRVAGRNRRLLLVALILAQTYAATYFMTAVLPYRGQHGLEIAILVIYAILFGWVSAGFWTALMGFYALLRARDRYAISATAAEDAPIGAGTRTAILFPICNEDVTRVFAGVRATWDSLCRAGLRDQCDLFILSDTYRADTRVAEVDAWLRLCREVDGAGRVFYRRRTHRIKRKSGNIADWCRRWGSRYKYMVILDADSVMSAAASSAWCS
ncbi:MAG: hypothetical protein WC809_07040 [Sinimarinibacterium sp.]|jgi:membrane glycosyltransferase